MKIQLYTIQIIEYFQMKHDHFDTKPLRNIREKSQQRSSSSNQLAKRLYRNNSLTRLVPLTSSISASLNTSLIPSVSLRKLAKLQHSQPSLQISQGRIYMRKSEQLPFLTQQSTLLKKKGVQRKFQKLENFTEKSIIPQQLKADRSLIDTHEEKMSHFRPSKKWLQKLKQSRESQSEKLTPEDFIRLVEEEGGLSNEFVYLQKGIHAYDLRIVEFAGVTADQYITISARGVTYFNWEGSRFVTLEEWRHEASLFNRLMELQFFGKYKLHKNFSNWKKYFRKVAMKKTMDKLKTQLLVNDRHLRQALLTTRGLCCRMESETNYCYFDDSVSALPFAKFKAAQDNYLTEKFQKRLNELQDEIKSQVAQGLGVSMHEFKEDNKISSGKEGKGLPLLIGDQKNLDMPYTKEATLRVQQQKFKRFLTLVDFLVVHSKINMMDEATLSTAHKLQEQNDSYLQFLAAQEKRTVKTITHFKGKQYIECELQLSEGEERVLLKPSREELIHLMEDIVNRSIMKLVRNHHRIINNPDINTILYEGTEEPPHEPDPINTLKTILGVEEKQEAMARLLTQAINISYSFLETYAATLAPLVAQYFCNKGQFAKISSLTSQDFFNIREWMQKWRKELQQNNKIHEEYESAVLLLNFKAVKEITCQCTNLCLTKFKEMVPKILESALRREEEQLKQALRLIEVTPVGIEVFIAFQHNKNTIMAELDKYEETLAQIGQLIDILKQLGGVGESTVSRSIKEKKQLGEMIKLLKARIEQAQMHSKGHECRAQEQVKKMIPKISYSLSSLYALTKQPRLEASLMVERISEWQQQFETINKEAVKLRGYQCFLLMQQLNEQEIHKFWQYFKTYKHVWVFCQQVDAYQTAFLATSWKLLNLQDIKLKIDAFLQEAQAIEKSISIVNREEMYQIEDHDINAVGMVVMDIKNRLKPIIEVVECLRDPALEERQQKFIRSDLQKRFKFRLSVLIGEHEGVVSELINEGLIYELDFLRIVVFKSKKQIELNSKMTAVSRFWNDAVGHSSKSLIDNFDQHYWAIAAQIDDKIRVINSVYEDPEVQEGEFRIRVETEKGMFDSLRVLLGEWWKHHNFLLYLEPIFSNIYWKGTSEFKIYTYAESNWKKLTKQISKDVSLRKLASQEKRHLSVFLQNNAIFAQLSRSVDLFLNVKREAFPKFYFIPNEQLLQLLLQDKEYSSIDKHLSLIFPNLKSLDLNEDRNCPLGVRNMADEYLPLRASPMKQVLELQEGLKVIEERIKESVRSGLLKCSNYYMQDDFNRKQWISENILQVLLFIGNAEFTKLLEYDYLQPDGDDLSQLLAFQLTQNKELTALSKEVGMSQMNSFYKLAVLLMQGNHFRDTIERLQQTNVQDQNSYEWQREIRSYYNGSEVAYTRYLTKSVDYGYEFVCANYSYSLSTLSERYFIELANTAGFHYLPVLVTRAHLVSHFCNSNARNYFSVALHPNLRHTYVNNLCQGALSSNSYLELTDAQFINEQVASLICSFMHEAKSILEHREVFHINSTGKNGLAMPTFNIFLRMGQLADLKPLQKHLKVNYRIINVPQISISAYLQFTMTLLFDNCDPDFPKRIQKACEIVNKCSGFTVFCTQQIRELAVRSASPVLADFKRNIFEELVRKLSLSVSEQQQLRFLESIMRQVILQENSDQILKAKHKPERDLRNLAGLIRQVLSRKRVCLIAGPSSSGKQHFILQAYVGAGIIPAEVFYTDLLSGEELLGHFQGQIWKQGILQQCIKRLSSSQQEWLVFEGKLTSSTEILLDGIVRGQLRLSNGEMLYLKPNWKFIFSTDHLPETVCLPSDLYVVANQNFAPSDDELQYLLESTLSHFFKSNIEGFAILKNLCLNNFQKVLKFRLKGRFLKAEHLLRSFVNILESVLIRCPQRLLQQRGNHIAIDKLFLWCIYWTLNSSLSFDNAKKFESQLFEQVKIQTDRSLPLSLSRFEMDNPLGSLKRVEIPTTAIIQSKPYYLNGSLQSIAKFIQFLLSNNKSVLLLGQNNCGKSTFLAYLKQSLGEQYYSFLRIRLSKEMKSETFNQLLYRKAKIVISPSKQKYLCANNGKKLILIIDDINLLREQSYIGRFFKSLLALGYYYDHDTLEKIYLSNITILAAENSAYEFDVSYELVKYFKPICLPSLNIRDIIPLYKEFINPEYSAHICHSVASLHEFVSACVQKGDSYFPINIDIPLRILNTLKEYSGKQKIVKIWEYVSMEYVFGFPNCLSSRNKIVAEIKNYSNLMLQDSQEDPNPVENYQNIIGQLIRKYPHIEIDNFHNDYYLYVLMILQLTKSPNLFTVNEPLCPSLKEEIFSDLCLQNNIELIHPFKSGNIRQKIKGLPKDSKLAVFAADSDQNFEQIIDFLMNEENSSLIYFIDFSTDQVWRSIIEKFPSLNHFGSRYVKNKVYDNKKYAEGSLKKELQNWIQIFKEKGQHIEQYARQEIQRIIPSNLQKIGENMRREINKNQHLLASSASILTKINNIRKQIEDNKNQLQEMVKSEDLKRKQLLNLKNDYENDETQAQKNMRNSKIQVIQAHLNEAMAKKRSNQDYTRTKQDEYNGHLKIIHVLTNILGRTEKNFSILKGIEHNLNKIAVFLTMTEYLLSQDGKVETQVLQSISLTLPIRFSDIMQQIFGCCVEIHEKILVLWAMSNKSCILQSSSDGLANLIEKRCPNTKVIKSVRQLQELDQFNINSNYIIFGQVRSEAKFLNDMMILNVEKENKERIKNKEQVKQFKEDRPIKDTKQEKADYDKNIYFIIKDMEKQKDEKLKDKNSKDVIEMMMNKTFSKESKQQLIPSRRADRKMTRMNSIMRATLFSQPVTIKKEESFFSKQKHVVSHLKQQLVISIKRRQVKQGQIFSKTDTQLQEFLTVNLQNEVFYKGGKIISKVYAKSDNKISNVTLICKPLKRQDSRQQIRQFEQVSQDVSLNFIQELLQLVDPISLGAILNLKQELQRLIVQVTHQQAIITDKMLQQSVKSLADIGKKDGDFLETLYDNMRVVQTKLQQTLSNRQKPYLAYFKLSTVLWKYISSLVSIYPLFRITKKQMQEIILANIKYNENIQIDGQITEPIDKIDQKVSQSQLVKALVQYVIGCLGIRESREALCLLAVSLQIHRESTSQFFLIALIRIIQKKTDALYLEQVRSSKNVCTKELGKLIESYISCSGDFIQQSHRYISTVLQFDFQQTYQTIKSGWLTLKQSFIAIALAGTDPFGELSELKNCLMTKQHSDHSKCLEIMVDKGLNRLILVNFIKEESYSRILTQFEQWPKEEKYHLIFLFTGVQFFRRCQFIHRLADCRIIQFQNWNTPQKQLISTIEKNFREPSQPEFEKVLKLVLYNQILVFFKQKLEGYRQNLVVFNSCFFGSDFMHALITEMSTLDARKLLDIACDTVLRGKQKWFVKESRKFLKKDQGDFLCKTFLGDATAFMEEHNAELSYFMSLDLMDIVNKIRTAEGCQDMVRLILPSQGRKILRPDLFFSQIIDKPKDKPKEEVEGSMSEYWAAVDNITFQNLKNLQSVKLKRQIDPLKIFLRKQNTRNYLMYRWVEHNIRSLKNIDRTAILSSQTKQILRKIKHNLPLWDMRQCIPSYLTTLQKKIIHIEEMYSNTATFKKLNLEYWTNPLQMAYIYLYSYGRKGDVLKQRFCCRYLVEKDNKGQRGWLLDEIDLKNCKFDAAKCCLQINEKNENRKLNGVAIVLVEKDVIQGPSIYLPLYCKGKEYLKLEFSSKFKDDSGQWRDGAMGIIKAELQ